MSDEKVRVYEVDELWESQDFNHHEEFVMKKDYDQLMKELELYKEKFESAANDANESRQAYNQLMKDARALRDILKDIFRHSRDCMYCGASEIAYDAAEDFDKKYPQLNEKE